jgi:hypothetical protein
MKVAKADLDPFAAKMFPVRHWARGEQNRLAFLESKGCLAYKPGKCLQRIHARDISVHQR